MYTAACCPFVVPEVVQSGKSLSALLTYMGVVQSGRCLSVDQRMPSIV